METIKLGLIADVQYCDCDNGWNTIKTKERFYRDSLNILDKALENFASNDCKNILQLGDIIDGKCRALDITKISLEKLAERFEGKEFEAFHVIGNHELYNLSREEFCNSFLGTSLKTHQELETDVNYYKVDLSSKIRLIVLDTYEFSVLNRRKDMEKDLESASAKEFLLKNNKNENWNESQGATQPKFVAYNGSVGQTQMAWLKDQLVECSEANKIVILAAHVPILSSDAECIVWNSEEIINLIAEFPCVKAYLAGHQHDGCIIRTNNFIHITMPGIIECPPQNTPFGIMEINEAGIRLSPMSGYCDGIEYNWV